MNWSKIIVFVLSAMIAIGGLYLTKPEKPKLAKVLSFLIIVSVIAGIVLEVKDVKSKKQQQDEVVAQNTELLGKIGTYQQDLREKEEKIKELDKKVKMSVRNVTSMYDFNGAKRQTSGGKINVVVGEELGIFQQMIEFAKAEDLPNLIKLCEKQIEKTPDWYTPYFYLGMAQADMGLKDEAIKNIRYVVDNTPGDPEYAEARKILERLEQQP